MPWCTDFFTELPNTFWRAAVPIESTTAEIDFLMKLPGDHVLDVACGSGRHALELAARGRRVTGVDVSAEAIAHATDAARNSGLSAEFLVGDMSALPVTTADTAICMGNAFGYLDHDETRAFLAGLTVETLVLDYAFAGRVVPPGRDPGGGADDHQRRHRRVGQRIRRDEKPLDHPLHLHPRRRGAPGDLGPARSTPPPRSAPWSPRRVSAPSTCTPIPTAPPYGIRSPRLIPVAR